MSWCMEPLGLFPKKKNFNYTAIAHETGNFLTVANRNQGFILTWQLQLGPQELDKNLNFPKVPAY